MTNTIGIPMVNFLCIVLWRHTFMPVHAPMLPPMTAIVSSVASDIRHFLFMDLYLSMPYVTKVTRLTAIM